MLKQIFDALADGESAQLSIERNGDEVAVTVMPTNIKLKEQVGDEAIERLRAALATPIRKQGDPEELSDRLIDVLQEYAATRGRLAGHATTIESMNAEAEHAEKLAKKATTKANKAKAKVAESSDDKAAADESNASSHSETKNHGKPTPAPKSNAPQLDL